MCKKRSCLETHGDKILTKFLMHEMFVSTQLLLTL